MDAISRIVDLIGTVSDAGALLTALGPRLLAGMAVIVFVESGVLFPFLPGDSLLVTAAVLRTSLGPGLWRVVSVCLAAAIAGDQAGYWLGSRCGRGLFCDDARVLRTAWRRPRPSSPVTGVSPSYWGASCRWCAPMRPSRPGLRGCPIGASSPGTSSERSRGSAP